MFQRGFESISTFEGGPKSNAVARINSTNKSISQRDRGDIPMLQIDSSMFPGS